MVGCGEEQCVRRCVFLDKAGSFHLAFGEYLVFAYKLPPNGEHTGECHSDNRYDSQQSASLYAFKLRVYIHEEGGDQA